MLFFLYVHICIYVYVSAVYHQIFYFDMQEEKLFIFVGGETFLLWNILEYIFCNTKYIR